ncbi:uncharacterized protein BYT42DRAFT_492972 [Radiomyces spectabilis]|uniref:uncharacterized protein n=1 Tax=Radiomyces spectabilis TaxID=64574 RepID=UPI00222114BA|nr:uncharacterized protein BYT42DRAFT_492972 [Radiomyces spectabilis]KAI8385018.1 hypothetical protein BYT42DRAFT_492972 [Radiomyces spectabilis]
MPPVEIRNTFGKVMEAIQAIPRDDLDFRLEVLKTIKRILKAYPVTRDIFRAVGGYVSLVSMIVALERAFQHPEEFTTNHIMAHDEIIDKLISVLQIIFAVFAESLRAHPVNKKYFIHDVGYPTLENALLLTGAMETTGIPQRLFGILFAFMLDDDTVYDLFQSDTSADQSHSMESRIEHTLADISMTVTNPEIAPTILGLQGTINDDAELSQAVLYALLMLAKKSRRNQVKLNSSGLILAALSRAFPREPSRENTLQQGVEKDLLTKIIGKLMTMGISYEELQYLFQSFTASNAIMALDNPAIDGLMDLILHGASQSRWPNFIQFNMADVGHSCLEVPSLPSFPPSSSGYTLMLWLHIERFDADAKLVLLSIYDSSRLTSKIYLDPSSRRLHIDVPGSKQTVKFESFEFREGCWYHLVLVHSRSRLGASLSACNQLVWDLGPCYLLLDTLEADAVNFYFNLGVRYKSLFQDSLRQFQTYEASTALVLNLRSVSKAFSRRDMSHNTIANAMRGGANVSMPENQIAFAFVASNVITELSHNGMTSTGMSDSMLEMIASEMEKSQLVLNTAIPKIASAIYAQHGNGYLYNEPVIAYPYGLDESMWKIGGCAVALRLIERSETSATLCKSTAILFEIIRYSWRNSEDMERSQGYEILAYLLKLKRELITIDLLELLLTFIGKDRKYPEDSIINNPFAYRYIILNFEIWKRTTVKVQKAHLDQFILFLQISKRRRFNMKRLQKVHLVKKMLLAFRMNIYAKELVPTVIHALKIVMMNNWNTENIRAVATFLASTVSQGKKGDKVHSMMFINTANNCFSVFIDRPIYTTKVTTGVTISQYFILL